MDEWMDWWMNEWIDGWMNGLMDGWMELMDGWMTGLMDEWIDWWMNGIWMDEWNMDGWMNGDISYFILNVVTFVHFNFEKQLTQQFSTLVNISQQQYLKGFIIKLWSIIL